MNGAALQMQIDALQQQVVFLQKSLEDARRENTLLRQKLDALAQRFFGKKSEQLDAQQLTLLLSGLKEATVEAPQTKPRQLSLLSLRKESQPKTQRIRVPDNLEVVSKVLEPEIVQAEPGQWKQISQEVSRLRDYSRNFSRTPSLKANDLPIRTEAILKTHPGKTRPGAVADLSARRVGVAW